MRTARRPAVVLGAVLWLAVAPASRVVAAPFDHSVTFRYHDPAAQSVFLAGDFNAWSATRDTMHRDTATGDFTRDVSLPPGARVDYKFIVDGRWILDPANPRTCTGGFGPNSEYATPEYVPAPEISRIDSIPHGRVDTFQFTSAILHNARRVQVYVPAGYDPHGRFPSVVFQDGGEYLSLANLANILDYGIAMGHVRPLIAICPDPVDRNVEYMLNDSYRQFVVRELLPHIDSLYATAKDDASLRGTVGASLGGLMAVMMAWRSPQIFGVAISQSGAFQVQGGRFAHEASLAPPARSIGIIFQTGTLEGDDFGRPTDALVRELRAAPALQPVGYMVNHSGDHHFEFILHRSADNSCFYHQRTYPEGHSWGNWRAHLLAALSAMWPMTH